MARPRNQNAEDRILEVTLRQLSQNGYSRMSIDSIAAEAGVSKPTIYRRWANKADLAMGAVRSLQLSEPAVDTGSAQGDLRGILTNFRTNLLRPYGMALVGTVLAEEEHTPELLRLFRERLVAPRRKALALVLQGAERRGELRPGVSITAAVNMLVGAIYAHYLASPEIPPHYVDEVVAVVWNGVANPVKSGGLPEQ
jgi:AcrR family transcriptional regulator